MEYLVFGIFVLIFAVALIGKGIYTQQKKQALFRESLRNGYGELPKREISVERFLRVNRYFQKHKGNGQLDDVTWNDLGMDEVFRVMNHTHSAIGEEYLYYCLRNTEKDLNALDDFEGMIRYFMEHEDTRVRFQIVMAKLGYMGKYSLYDYLDHLDILGERSNVKAYVRNGIILAFLALMPFRFPIALTGLLFMLIINNLVYFREKGEIEPYVISFAYILKLLECAENVQKEFGNVIREQSELFEELERLKHATSNLKNLRKGAYWVLYGNGSLGGDPAGLMFDTLKMAFHVDLIRFNRMLKFLRGHADAVDEICTCLGRMETAVAVGAYRAYLEKRDGYTVPVLVEWQGDKAGSTSIKMEEGYHPLLEHPVKNSIETKKGVLLTGSNASGKSTFLKTVALNAVMAQTIHTCTAKQYEASLFCIMSSMSLSDDLQGGDSYYIVEIKSLKRILEQANKTDMPVLCFVDEVLRGTNTVERIAASTEILKSFRKSATICFAATHDIELTELLEGIYENYHFTEEIQDGDVIFSYRLLEGKATTRNAIKLLEIMGYDQSIIERAESLAAKFVKDGSWK